MIQVVAIIAKPGKREEYLTIYRSRSRAPMYGLSRAAWVFSLVDTEDGFSAKFESGSI